MNNASTTTTTNNNDNDKHDTAVLNYIVSECIKLASMRKIKTGYNRTGIVVIHLELFCSIKMHQPIKQKELIQLKV